MPAQDATQPADVGLTAPLASEAVVEAHPERVAREDRDRERTRPDRREHRDRDRHADRERHDEAEAEAAAAAPPSEGEPATKVDDVARAALDRADKTKRRDKRSEPTAETREFWETWAESKTTREPAAAEAAPTEETERPRERSRERGREREKEKTRGRDKRDARSDRSDKRDKQDKKEDSGRSKREATAAADGGQVRLFVSLGKKHGVSADDLRALLAGAVGGDTARIGSVSLRDSHAHVRVPDDLADAIIAGVHGTTHGEHSVTVERSRS
jgi:hypothetical protein